MCLQAQVNFNEYEKLFLILMKMKKYDPKKIEKKWQEKWYGSDLYAAVDFDDRDKFYCLVEFPYPSGEGLHVGHSRTYTMIDSVARLARHKGKNVMFPMGWDAFGLPAENYAIKHKVHPAEVTKNNIDNFRRQMKMLGISFDFSREVNTTDPDYYKWTQWIFVQLFKKGLAYKKELPINWCPKCKTGLANEEVVDGKHERCGEEVGEKKLSQWVLKITEYADRLADELDQVDFSESIVEAQRNWIGRKEWIDITFEIADSGETFEISTTSPETIFGVSFIVVAPEHPIFSKEKGLIPDEFKDEVEKYKESAAKKSEIERMNEKMKKTGVFSGIYAINPANGEKVPVWMTDFVLMTVGTGAVMGVPGHDKRDFQFAKEYGLPIPRVVVGSDGKKGEIKKISDVQYEEGTVINSDLLNGMDVKDANRKIIDLFVKKGIGKSEVRYHLRDWIFSRQHYWGEPIPMIHCDKCGEVPVPEDELPVELPDVESYEPTDTGESPLAAITDWVNTKCPKCGGKAKRETDTMPNWAGSSWYFLRYCDPKCDTAIADPKKLDYWMPVDFYDGGAEHTTLHLLYSRFWHKFLNDIGVAPGKEPYAKRRNHGLVLGEGGVIMSKSKGNVINPDDIVAEYGTDVTRLYVLFMGPYTGTCEWSTKAIQGVNRFVKKFWSFFIEKADDCAEKCDEDTCRELDKLIVRIEHDIENLKFNTAVAAFMEWYNDNFEKKFCKESLEKLVVTVAPFMPHIAEEFWAELGHEESVHRQAWPEVDESNLIDDVIEIPVQINGKVRARIMVASDASEVDVRKTVEKEESVKKHLGDKKIKKFIYVPGRIATVVC